jgi:hypothetical protein
MVLSFLRNKYGEINILTFFLTKIKWYSFIKIEIIHQINMIKLNDESVNKLTSSKLIVHNGKMPTTNNMIKLKSPVYPCFRIWNINAQIID